MLTLRQFTFSALLLLCCAACSKKHDPTGNNTLRLQSFTPTHALPGATVTLSGEHFSTVKQENHVTFNGEPTDATVLTATSTTLTVTVPAAATTGKIKVRVNNQTVQSATDFTVDADVTAITDFTPKQGAFGTEVTITGRKFGTDIKVSLDDVEAAIKQKSATQIVFIIPTNTRLTAHKIKVESDGTMLQTNENFTITSTGPYAQWLPKVVNAAPAAIFQMGTSFVYKNKIYWGFTKMSFLQTQSEYMVLDPTVTPLQWVVHAPPADMAPAELQNTLSIVHNNKVYIGTGLAPTASNKWWEFDPENNTSKALADYPEATHQALAFVLNGQLYAGFGGNNKKLHRYDPSSNTWALAATAAVQDITSASAFVIGNDAFIGRALMAPGGERTAFLKFSGGNAFTTMNVLPESIQSPKTPSFVLNNKGYFVTHQKTWEYTPDANGGSWRVVESLENSPVIKHTATVTINGQQVIFGWTDSGKIYEFKMN